MEWKTVKTVIAKFIRHQLLHQFTALEFQACNIGHDASLAVQETKPLFKDIFITPPELNLTSNHKNSSPFHERIHMTELNFSKLSQIVIQPRMTIPCEETSILIYSLQPKPEKVIKSTLAQHIKTISHALGTSTTTQILRF